MSPRRSRPVCRGRRFCGARHNAVRDGQTQDQITITKNGAPAAVLVGADEWESLQETLYWLSQPGIKESIAAADADIAAGRTYGEDEIRAEFGVPGRAD